MKLKYKLDLNEMKGGFVMDFWMWFITLLFVFECRCQYQTVTSREEVPEYEAKQLYDLMLDVKPISAQVIKDTRHAEATYDLVYISSSSEIRLISDLTYKINYEKEMLMQTKVITNGYLIPFPNRVEALPLGTIDRQPAYVWYITAGDLDRASDTGGGIYVIDLTRELWRPVPIVKDPKGKYTHVFWGDMDVDGRKDCVTVRETTTSAQLVWLKHPEGSGQWNEVHAISNTSVGGSVFKVLPMRKEKNKVQNLIFVAGKTTTALTVFWTEDPDNDWTQLDRIHNRRIDSSEQFVDVNTIDLNGDGVPDILATVSALAGKPGKLVAYELPKTRRYLTAKWRKHVLMEWPSTASATFKSISPSHAIAFKVGSSERTRQKKRLLVSGGSDKKVYVLVPVSWSHVIWRYTLITIFEGTTTIGRPEVKNVDGDGLGTPEIFIPTGNRLYVMRYDLHSSASKPARMKFIRIFLISLVSIVTYLF